MANLSNINNKFLVTTGGNVLIGGTAVVGAAKLQVTGEVRVYTGSNLGYWGVDAGNSYVYLGTNSSAYGLSLQTGGIDRVNINDAGNVFISTPITNAFYGLSLTYNNTNTADFTVNQATGQIKIGGTAAGYFPTFYSAGTERMRITSGGQVQVGYYNTARGGANTTFMTGKSGTTYLELNGGDVNGEGGLLFADGSGGDYGLINYSHVSDIMQFYTASAERMRIDSSGRTIIQSGTLTAPAYTPAQGYPLHVQGIASQSYISIGRAGQTTGSQGMIIGIDTGSSYLWNRDNVDIQFGTNDAFKMIIKSGGNVGIGTPSPGAKLEVVTAVGGDAIRLNFGQSADIFLGFNSANPRILLQDNSNVVTHNFQSNGDNYIVGSNVGIGLTAPQVRLQTNLTITGSLLAYLNGTSATFDAQSNIAVVHNSPSIGSATAAGLVLANNDKSDGAPSPIIAFSAKSASNGYNHTYAAIYGVRTATGADTNWTKGDLVFATGDGTGPKERMRILNNGNISIPNGSIEMNPSGGQGIYLGSNNGSNLLDYYEEGAWTPVLGGTWTTNPTNIIGHYTKIGRQVTIIMQFLGGVKSSSVSGYFTGIPFSIDKVGTGSVTNSGVSDLGNCLFANGDRVWLTATSLGSGTVYVSGTYFAA